jgi:cbb3-type cytochrome oxidase maturation protein
MEFLYLVPIALALGAAGLGAFLWSLRDGQYEDLDGAGARILITDDDAPPLDPESPDTEGAPTATPSADRAPRAPRAG